MTPNEKEHQRNALDKDAIVKNLPGVLSILDKQGKILFMNQAPPEYELEAITGRPVSDFLQGVNEELFMEAVSRVIVSKKSETIEIFADPPGRERRYWSSKMVPYTGIDGESLVLNFAMDITDRKTLEIESRQNEEALRIVTENMPEYLIQMSREGLVEFMNKPAPGKTMNDMIGINVKKLMEPDFHDAFESALDNVFTSGESDEYAAVGSVTGHWYRNKINPVINNGSVESAVLITHNITELKKVEAELSQAVRDKEVLLRELHHRVKNNLQIISSLFRLQARRSNNPELMDYFKQNESRIRTMALIHERLYKAESLSGIELGGYVSELARSVCRSYLDDPARIDLQVDAEEMHVDLDLSIPCGLMINEILTNALLHAFPSDRGGVLKISLMKEGKSRACLAIKDDGAGFDTTRPCDNSLGLTLIGELSKQIGADLECRSKVGKGTSYRICFDLEV